MEKQNSSTSTTTRLVLKSMAAPHTPATLPTASPNLTTEEAEVFKCETSHVGAVALEWKKWIKILQNWKELQIPIARFGSFS